MRASRGHTHLHPLLRGFPGAVIEVSRIGTVLDSNGRLDERLGCTIVDSALEQYLDDSSRLKWRHLLASGGGDPNVLWEFVFECGNTLELRTFAAIWSGESTEPTLWLVEYTRDAKLAPLYEELSAVNTELSRAQRNVSKERARLARALKLEAEARHAAERATSRMHTLHAMAAALGSADEREAARSLLTRLREAITHDTAAVYLLDDGGAVLTLFEASGLETENADALRLRVEGTFAGRVARSGISLLVNDPANSDIGSEFLRSRMRSVAGAPLLVAERTIGVLRIGAIADDAFAPDDMRMLELVARDLAVAIERARLLDRERAARADAERAVRLRDEVLAIVAHDLRNPVARVAMTADLLAEENLAPESRRELLAVMRRSASVMDRLIRDLLDAARIEAGSFRVDRRSTDLTALMTDVHESFEPQAMARSIQLRLDVPADAVTISADPDRLQQVLVNLLDNALRLTPKEGAVTMGLELEDKTVTLRVADTGPGIAPEDLPYLFDRFWQGARGKRGSAGLGLAISRGIATAHGGQIRAESTVGVGTTFYLELSR